MSRSLYIVYGGGRGGNSRKTLSGNPWHCISVPRVQQVRESAHTSFMKDIASRVALWQTVESGHVIQAKTVHNISMLTL